MIATDRRPALLAALAVLALLLARVLYFQAAPDEVLIAVIPDDAFYYLQMAKHRLAGGFWTFDGSSPATGFHFLYGYLLVLVYAVAGDLDWRQLYLLVSVCAAFSIAAAAYFCCRGAARVFGQKVVPLAVAPFLGAATVFQSTAMMESWLVLLLSALTVYAVVCDRDASLGQRAALLALGALGSLARSDYGMLPGVLFCVSLVGRRWLDDRVLARCFFVLAGATTGVALGLLHNLLTSGHLYQASAQTKLHWSSVDGHSLLPAIHLAVSAALPFLTEFSQLAKVAGGIALVAILVLGYASSRPSHRWSEKPNRKALLVFISSVLTVGGYILFYRHNSAALQIWYTSNLVVPLAMAMAGGGFFLLQRAALAVPVAVVTVALFAWTGVGSVTQLVWPHQVGMMRAGLALKLQPAPAAYGAWNAGIVSYFSGLPVVNIDGLTNDDLLVYIKQNRLFDYLKARNIAFLVDYEEMLGNPLRRRRGGYADERFDRCVRPLQALDGDAPDWVGTHLRLYQVVPGCS